MGKKEPGVRGGGEKRVESGWEEGEEERNKSMSSNSCEQQLHVLIFHEQFHRRRQTRSKLNQPPTLY